ncbi:MAG: hypothetical protein K8I01_07830 [Candidatus Methylomirabilis sp.]|nr:hypothetical protein [Deltaproteobacteria bacterium]
MSRLVDLARELSDKAKKHLSGEGAGRIRPEDISIGITTFEARFDRYFTPLLCRLREYVGNEIVVAVNGENGKKFSEEYRKNVLKSAANQENVFPILFPSFRGLSKLWNSIIIHASNDYILMLNDDIMISRPDFMEKVCMTLSRNNGRSFQINGSWSHFLIAREEIDELGYFDERLLGIGEEDGDIIWRYQDRYGREVANFKIKGFENFAEESTRTYTPINIRTHSGTKYSLFNRKFILEEKYQESPEGLKGIFDKPVIIKNPSENQYPSEKFYRQRRNEL